MPFSSQWCSNKTFRLFSFYSLMWYIVVPSISLSSCSVPGQGGVCVWVCVWPSGCSVCGFVRCNCSTHRQCFCSFKIYAHTLVSEISETLRSFVSSCTHTHTACCEIHLSPVRLCESQTASQNILPFTDTFSRTLEVDLKILQSSGSSDHKQTWSSQTLVWISGESRVNTEDAPTNGGVVVFFDLDGLRKMLYCTFVKGHCAAALSCNVYCTLWYLSTGKVKYISRAQFGFYAKCWSFFPVI